MSKRGQGAAAHLRAGAGVALQPGVILSARAAALRRLQEKGKRSVKRQKAWCLEWGETQATLSEVGTSTCKEQAEKASNKFSYFTHEKTFTSHQLCRADLSHSAAPCLSPPLTFTAGEDDKKPRSRANPVVQTLYVWV